MNSFDKQATLQAAWELAQTQLANEPSGHDIFHIRRVVKLAKYLASKCGYVDDFLLELSCILHDIDDPKIVKSSQHISVSKFLIVQNVPPVYIDRVLDIIDNISYTSTLQGKKQYTLEGKIAQDADRLDAIGAIGIARAFAFGGHKGRPIHDFGLSGISGFQHFEDKLLKLEELMNTQEGKKIAKQRTVFIEIFMKQFIDELDLKK